VTGTVARLMSGVRTIFVLFFQLYCILIKTKKA
jgi:hypothetical protein